MITIKSDREIELLRKAGHIVYETHQYLKPYIKAGITTKELDALGEAFIRKQGALPSFKGYEGFPNALCISVNEEVVHGIPGDYVLKEGDIVSIDIGACYHGYHGDSAWSYAVGEVSSDVQALLKNTEQALYEGLKAIHEGVHIGDIGEAVESYATQHHLGVVKELVGHGVGTNVHEDPDVPNYGTRGTGPKLKKGMVLAVEPMLTLGSPEIFIDSENGWTIITDDNQASAHFEHTVVVTEDGCEILTGE